jgi:phosphodiesterase/alkaline phosphatase D-like protein
MGRLALILVGLASLIATAAAVAAIASAPSAATGPVSSVGGTKATVTGTVNPGGEATTWYVEYGTSTSYGTKTAAKSAGSGSSSVSVSVELTGLSAATTYHYRVVASNGSSTARGADAIVTTLSAPGVSTGTADEIGPFSAKLHGRVDPNGLATTYYFEYGATTSYGTRTTTQNAGSGTSAIDVSAVAQGLEAGHTYHYRLVASSEAGTSHGSDHTFATDSAPGVRTGSASSITAATAVVSGVVNPLGRASVAWFDYGTTTSYGSSTALQDVGGGTQDKNVTAMLSGLKAGTTYHFRAAARSSAGTVYGKDASFRTVATPTIQTGPVTGIGPDRATFTGSITPNGRSTTWWVELGTSTRYTIGSTRVRIGSSTAPVAVSLTVTRLQPGTTYHFRLVASNSAGTTRGPDGTFQTVGAPSISALQVTRVSTTSVLIAAKLNPLALDATYWVEYGRTTAYSLRTPVGSVKGGIGEVNIAVPLSGLEPGRRYHFRVVAASAGGTTATQDASFGTAPLPRDARGRLISCTIVGTVGPDRLVGTPGPDVICGLGGSDVILGRGGADVIYAGPGNDIVDGGAGRDEIHAGSGDDHVSGGLGADWIDGGRGHDVMMGGPGRDTLIAADGVVDSVNGGPGRDRARYDGRDRRVSIERRLR